VEKANEGEVEMAMVFIDDELPVGILAALYTKTAFNSKR